MNGIYTGPGIPNLAPEAYRRADATLNAVRQAAEGPAVAPRVYDTPAEAAAAVRLVQMQVEERIEQLRGDAGAAIAGVAQAQDVRVRALQRVIAQLVSMPEEEFEARVSAVVKELNTPPAPPEVVEMAQRVEGLEDMMAQVTQAVGQVVQMVNDVQATLSQVVDVNTKPAMEAVRVNDAGEFVGEEATAESPVEAPVATPENVVGLAEGGKKRGFKASSK